MSKDSILIERLAGQRQSTLHEQSVGDRVLTVKETAQYRWFTLGGESIQSLMSKAQPEQPTTLVSHALLLFLLFDKEPKRLLNLGLGGGTIERALAAHSEYQVTSVESSQTVVDVASAFFSLPEIADVFCENAEQFVRATQESYGVVVCDLYEDERLPDFMSGESFYANLKRITVSNAVVMLNIQVDAESELLALLLCVRKHFSHVALIEFENYKNLVAVCSTCALPEKHTFESRLSGYSAIDFSCLRGSVEGMRYLPHI